jgi:hypothetical protein
MTGVKGMLVKGRSIVWTTHPQYKRWKSMWDRCTKEWHPKYPRYGARGISVCDRWRDFEMFVADMAALGECPPGFSIDRINNNGNYEPGNVRWASIQEQIDNRSYPYNRRTKSPSHTKTVVSVDGVEISLPMAAELLGVRHGSLVRRLQRMRKRNPNMPRIIDIQALKSAA